MKVYKLFLLPQVNFIGNTPMNRIKPYFISFPFISINISIYSNSFFFY